MKGNTVALFIGLIVIAIAIFLIWFFVKKTKRIVPDHVHLITGGVKCGKTTLGVATALRLYRRVVFRWRVRCFFIRILNFIVKPFKKVFEIPEKPLLYSNFVLAVPFVPLTDALINRKERFRYKSVILVSESSLVADSYDIRNEVFNDNFSLFNKLIGHSTKGGYLIYETQALSDNHFSVKRVLAHFSLITRCYKWIPFFIAFKVREVAYNADMSVDFENHFSADAGEDDKLVFVSKRVWKKFDAYTYSVFTDNLPVADREVVGDKKNLKTNYLLEVNSRGRNK